MEINVRKHPIADNLIMSNNMETVLLGVERIDVGVPTDNMIIKTDPETGQNYKVPEVVPQTVYSLKDQKHRAWFVLDLETGTRGWTPEIQAESIE